MPSPILRTKLGFRVLDIGSGADGQSGNAAYMYLSDSEAYRATYRAYATFNTFDAAPTDVVYIRGSATRTIRLKQIVLSGTATAATNVLVQIIKRSTANVGGTPVTITGFSSDSGDDVVTATVQRYTANPTPGTAVGTIDGGRLNLAPAANGSIDRLSFTYNWLNDKAIILSGVAEGLALNFGGIGMPVGAALDVALTWVEESANL